MENLHERSMEVYNYIQNYASEIDKLCNRKNYQKKYDRQWFPKYQKIQDKFNLTYNEVKEILNYLIKQKLIINNKAHYYINWVYDKWKELNKPDIKQNTNIFKKIYNCVNNYNFIFKIIIIIFCIAFIIIGKKAAEVSYDFSKFWFSQILSDIKLANKIASIFTIFEIFSKMLAYIFKQQKDKTLNSISKWISFLFWIAMISSIFFTIFGQVKFTYEKQDQYYNETYQENKSAELNKSYNKTLNRLNKNYDSYIKQRDRLVNQLNNFNEDITADRKKIKNIEYKIVLQNKNINRLEKDIEKQESLINKQHKKGEKTKVIEKPDIFVWFSGLFNYKLPSKWIQFSMYCLPAIFIDLIFPFCFHFVLVLIFKFIITKE